MINQLRSNNIDRTKHKSLSNTHESNKKTIINQYLQDIYRFLHRYVRKDEFFNVFSKERHFDALNTLLPILDESDTLRIDSEIYFNNGSYLQAIFVYNQIIAMNSDDSRSILQKIGFSYENVHCYVNALKYYLQY